MIPWIHHETTQVPGGDELKLMQRGSEFSIRLGRTELMNSRLSGSEEALATRAWEKISDCRNPAVLIGGLGMGFTLKAALDVLPDDARVVVAELVPAVVRWAKGPMAEIFGGSLEDPRVEIRVDDVGEIMRRDRKTYDAILLDVDNGPEGLTREANDGLYGMAGLGIAKAALKPGGVLAIWSCFPDDRFAGRLAKTGFEIEEIRVRAHRGKKGARHVIWLATA
ncbi:spermidine synthase [Lutibaculum baratangense]|uniref:Spermidine synthase n=1 Tax=Lutibaculum baratangense AMV1 TaxID=631454 RepID=V4T8M6_9HYPH|nr:spermidine synthase [Lutibaculum baratangense]ESR22893.1 Spermidine synthase [Lutibaculum baratangense AMV1]